VLQWCARDLGLGEGLGASGPGRLGLDVSCLRLWLPQQIKFLFFLPWRFWPLMSSIVAFSGT